ncbi:MAG: protein-L-isoaspartate O-methyltransferase family protein [Acetobacteraceae bacterium]
MDLATFDFADARARMVDSQIRPNKVSDPRILSAMGALPRERFVPPGLAPLAYVDEDIPLGGGRVMPAPMTIARLVQLLAPEAGERALVVAAGTGYGAALLAACGARVTALEDDPALHAIAARMLAETAPGVDLIAGPLGAGWPAGAPYDLILIEGAVRAIPPAFAGQLRADGGRLVTVRQAAGTVGQAVLAEPTPLGLRARPVFDCAIPLLPQLLAKPAFVF